MNLIELRHGGRKARWPWESAGRMACPDRAQLTKWEAAVSARPAYFAPALLLHASRFFFVRTVRMIFFMVALLNPEVPSLQDAIDAERQQLARNVKSRRQMLGMTQPEFAELVGKSQAFVSMIESAACDPRFATLVSVAKALNTTVSDLTNSEKNSEAVA